MRLCFINGLIDAENVVIENILSEQICKWGTEAFIFGEEISADDKSLTIWRKIRIHHPNIRFYILTHRPPDDNRDVVPEWIDGLWYPAALQNKPTRSARRLAGCLIIDQSLQMIDSGYGRFDLPGMLSDYAESRSKRGWIHITRVPRRAK